MGACDGIKVDEDHFLTSYLSFEDADKACQEKGQADCKCWWFLLWPNWPEEQTNPKKYRCATNRGKCASKDWRDNPMELREGNYAQNKVEAEQARAEEQRKKNEARAEE